MRLNCGYRDLGLWHWTYVESGTNLAEKRIYKRLLRTSCIFVGELLNQSFISGVSRFSPYKDCIRTRLGDVTENRRDVLQIWELLRRRNQPAISEVCRLISGLPSHPVFLVGAGTDTYNRETRMRSQALASPVARDLKIASKSAERRRGIYQRSKYPERDQSGQSPLPNA